MKKSLLTALALASVSEFGVGKYKTIYHWKNKGRKRTTTAAQQRRDKVKRKNKAKQ